ncbi:hypothetical protein B6V72_03125 [Thioclava sp. F34-6]|nr:hypothetical protein B6V72_03125 [Thioclava sp. F34-6]
MLARRRAHRDPFYAVDPNGGAAYPFAPYFFFHYIFADHVRSHPGAKDVWQKTPKISAIPAHSLGAAAKFGDMGQLCEKSLRQMISSSPIHKLNWRLYFPQTIFDLAGEKTQK